MLVADKRPVIYPDSDSDGRGNKQQKDANAQNLVILFSGILLKLFPPDVIFCS